MKKHCNKTKLVAALLSILLLATGCSKQEPASSSQSSDTSSDANITAKEEVIVAVGGEKESGYDPCTGWGSHGTPLFQSKLLDTDTNNQLKNDLATDYSVSEDGLTWTFTIRDDVVCHDGVNKAYCKRCSFYIQ